MTGDFSVLTKLLPCALVICSIPKDFTLPYWFALYPVICACWPSLARNMFQCVSNWDTVHSIIHYTLQNSCKVHVSGHLNLTYSQYVYSGLFARSSPSMDMVLHFYYIVRMTWEWLGAWKCDRIMILVCKWPDKSCIGPSSTWNTVICK